MKQRDDIIQFLVRHLGPSQDASGRVILMAGPWGCGKTFLWRTDVVPKLTNPPVTVSLFGVDSLSTLKTLIMNASLTRHASQLTEKEMKKTPKLLSKFMTAGLRRLVDATLGTNLSITIDPLNFVDDDLVICLDDVERASRSLPLEEILGVATLLSETKRARVLMVMNEEQLRQRDDGADKVMERFRERVVHAHVAVDADVESMLDLFTRAHSKNPSATTLLGRARPYLLSAFLRSQTKNLRTLSRVVDKLLHLTEVIGVPRVSAEHIAFLTAAQIEFDAGRLRSPDFYNFSEIEFFAFSTVEKKNEETLQRNRFYSMFHGDGSPVSYTFFQPLYDFVSQGFLDRAAALAMVAQTADLSELEILLQEAESRGWWFYSDEQYAVLNKRMLEQLQVNDALTAVQVIMLLVFIVEGARHAGLTLPPDLNDKVKALLIAAARRGDDSFSSLQRMKWSSFHMTWKEFSIEYDRELAAHESTTRAATVDQLISKRDIQGFLTIVTKNPNNLRAACEGPNLTNIVDAWSDDRQFQFLALAQIAEELTLNAPGIMSDAPALAAQARTELGRVLALPTIGRSDQMRMENLVQKFSRI